MQTRSGAEVVVDGDLVHKLHRPGTDPRALGARLRVAAEADDLLSPVSTVAQRVGTRWRSTWPRVETVVPQPGDLPWAEAGRVLAQLHRHRVTRRLPAHGWPLRLRRAVDILRGHDHPVIRRAMVALPDPVWRAGSPGRPTVLVHGDFHLGQLGRRIGDPPLVLIDVDDLGLGDPAWDLARPAGFWAAGLVPDDDWQAFIDAYRDAAGPALAEGDPWPVLEPFARAAVVQAAVHHRNDQMLLAACARMT